VGQVDRGKSDAPSHRFRHERHAKPHVLSKAALCAFDCAILRPFSQNYSNFASRFICAPASTTETGQVFLVYSACSRNFASSIPGTSASVFTSMVVIFGPPPTISNFTLAVVLMRFAGCPAFSRLAESAIEKQLASAAAISSSGLVPFPSSKRDEKEYGPSNASLPSFIVPLPSLRVPSHIANPVLVAIVRLLQLLF